MEKLEEMQCVVLRQEDASETEEEGLQNCGQTSSVVWCGDMGNNERTRSTTRSSVMLGRFCRARHPAPFW